MIFLLLMLVLPQESYFLDAVEIIMRDGTIIKTSAEVIEDRLFYSWNEDGYNVTLEKARVKSIRYFAVRVPGRKPYQKSKNATQRRISGQTVAFEVEGQARLKCRHVDLKGRSTEGIGTTLNLVAYLGEIEQSVDGRVMEVSFTKTTPASTAIFKFYDLKGALLFSGSLDIPAGKGRGKTQTQNLNLVVPNELDLFQVGLVEVISEKNAK